MAVGVLVAGLAAVVGVASASAAVAPSFSATNVATCHGSSTVTVTVKAQNPPPVQQAADIVLLADSSGSIGTTDFALLKNSLEQFIGYASPSPDGNHIGVIQFSSTVDNVSGGLLANGTELQTMVSGMPWLAGYTHTLDGLKTAEAMLNGPSARKGVPKVILVETDGVWTPSNQNPAAYAYNLVQNDGVNIFAVGVGSQVNPTDLLAIAGGVRTNVFPISDYSTLESTLDNALLEAIPAATNLGYEVTPAPGWTITGTPSATAGAATVSGGDLSWSLGSINSATETTVTITYTEQHTGSAGGSAVPLASSATLAYTDATGTAQSVDYKDQTVSVSGCDTTPPSAAPSLSPPANANGWNNTDVRVNWNWSDNAGGSGIDPSACTTSSTSSGEGTQTLTASCTDLAGNTGTASYTVKVDKTAPSLTTSGDVVVDATSPAGATVAYVAPTATDGGSGVASVGCTPGSGTLFPIGTTTVTCSATDEAGNTRTGSFTVHVNSAAEQLANLLTDVTGAGPGKSLASKVKHIQADVAANDTAVACDELAAFIHEVNAQEGKQLADAQATSFIGQAQNIEGTLGC